MVRGGNKLVLHLNKLAAEVNKKVTLRVGFLSDAKYPDGTSVAMVAAIQDFGAPSRNIPPRPFFRNMIADHASEWPSAIANLLKANKMDVMKTLRQTGEVIAGQLRQSIIDTNAPPLSPKTIAAKSGKMTPRQKKKLAMLGVMGPEKPLVASGTMLDSVDFEIETT